jgi:P pilus assembly chaperone PapD
MYSRRDLTRLSLAVVATAALPEAAARGQIAPVGANLNVSPNRVVFAPNMRSATVLVFNTGTEPATYNISLVDRVMTPQGAIVAAEDAPKDLAAAAALAKLKSAKEMIVFTPHRVVLAPGENQTIRIIVLRPEALADGDYRTHLTITAVPPPDTGLTAEQAANQAAKTLGIRLTALFSLSIPLIVRQGPAQPAAGIADVRYQPPITGGPAGGVLSFDILRKGASSLYGLIEVREAGAGKSDKPLGALGGVGVYAEIDQRAVNVPLAKSPAHGQQLEIRYIDEDVKPGQTLATGHFTFA